MDDSTGYNEYKDGAWLLETRGKPRHTNWPLTLRFKSHKYGFKQLDANSTIRIKMNIERLQGIAGKFHSDWFYTFAVNNKYFSFAFGNDNGVTINGTRGVFVYPYCEQNSKAAAGPLATASTVQPVDFLKDNNTTYNRSLDIIRANLADGKLSNWHQLTNDTGQPDENPTFTIRNADDRSSSMVYLRFERGSTDIECVYLDKFDTETDFYMFISGDTDNEKNKITSFEIESSVHARNIFSDLMI